MPDPARTKPDDYARRIGKEFGLDIVAEPVDKPRYGDELYFIQMWSVAIDGQRVGKLWTWDEINVFLDGIVVGLSHREYL